MEIAYFSLISKFIEKDNKDLFTVNAEEINMSELENTLGSGYQQIIIGFVVFIVGAFWGGIQADGSMTASDIYWPALTMLAGGMITLLGISFGTDKEDDRTNDLMDAINELTERLNSMVAKVSGQDSEE